MDEEENLSAGKAGPQSAENKNISEPSTINYQPSTNMEVHKHPHHVTHKKKWGEYLLEFFMLFLAVFLGFVAENVRENIAEHHREKEYIRSLVEDLKSDTAKLNRDLALNTEQSEGYDSLINYWYAKPYSDSAIRYMYYLYRKYTGTSHRVSFTRRTIDQLRNAGGMALLRNKTASDSIINYYEFVDQVERQIEIFVHTFQHEALQSSYHIFDWSVLRGIPNSASSYKLLEIREKINFLDAGISDRNTYTAQLQVSGAVLKNYITMLLNEQQRCLRLIAVLQKEYHLENE